MKKIIIISTLIIGINCYSEESKVVNNIEPYKPNKSVIPEDERGKAFEEIVEDASKQLMEWAKKLKSSPQPKIIEKSKSKEEGVNSKPKTYEEELNSKEFMEERDKLFEYLNAGNAAKVRKQLELIKQKFPAIAKTERLGFKYNEALSFIFEKNFSKAKKLLSEIISEIEEGCSPTEKCLGLEDKIPDGESRKNYETNKLFFSEVYLQRGIINLIVDKNFSDAAYDFEAGLKFAPRNDNQPRYERNYAHLVTALIFSHRIKDAALWYKKAFEVYPDFHKRPNEHTNICKNIINAGYLELCPPCKDVAENMGK